MVPIAVLDVSTRHCDTTSFVSDANTIPVVHWPQHTVMVWPLILVMLVVVVAVVLVVAVVADILHSAMYHLY